MVLLFTIVIGLIVSLLFNYLGLIWSIGFAVILSINLLGLYLNKINKVKSLINLLNNCSWVSEFIKNNEKSFDFYICWGCIDKNPISYAGFSLNPLDFPGGDYFYWSCKGNKNYEYRDFLINQINERKLLKFKVTTRLLLLAISNNQSLINLAKEREIFENDEIKRLNELSKLIN